MREEPSSTFRVVVDGLALVGVGCRPVVGAGGGLRVGALLCGEGGDALPAGVVDPPLREAFVAV